MKAPNGKPTKLSEKQWVQVRTPAFKEWFGDWEVDSRNTEVNRQIEDWAAGDILSSVILNIGKPSDVLLEHGVADLPITLTQMVINKAVNKKHDVSVKDLKDIVMSVQSPIAIFKDKAGSDTRIIVTEIRHSDGNVIAVIRMNTTRDGLEINDIRSIHPKRDSSIAYWVGDGLLLGLEKDKGRKWLENSVASNSRQPQVSKIGRAHV